MQRWGCSSVVERSLCMWKVRGSIPRISTTFFVFQCVDLWVLFSHRMSTSGNLLHGTDRHFDALRHEETLGAGCQDNEVRCRRRNIDCKARTVCQALHRLHWQACSVTPGVIRHSCVRYPVGWHESTSGASFATDWSPLQEQYCTRTVTVVFQDLAFTPLRPFHYSDKVSFVLS